MAKAVFTSKRAAIVSSSNFVDVNEVYDDLRIGQQFAIKLAEALGINPLVGLSSAGYLYVHPDTYVALDTALFAAVAAKAAVTA